MIRKRQVALPFALAVLADYAPLLPKGLYRELTIKSAGAYTSSGAGIDSLDAGFGFLGRTELILGGDAKIALQGSDLRFLSAAINGAPHTLLPSSIAAGSGVHSAKAVLPFDAFHPLGALDARGRDMVFKGKTGALTNLGTTVTAISGFLNVSGETIQPRQDGLQCEPKWVSDTVDISAANAESKSIYRVGTKDELCAMVMIRVNDASLVAGDPNSARGDGFIRKVRIERQSAARGTEEVWRGTWAEALAFWTSKARLASVDVPQGVVVIPLRDPDAKRLDNGLVRLNPNDTLTVYMDTAASIEPEFTATTPAAGDLAFVSYINYVPNF